MVRSKNYIIAVFFRANCWHRWRWSRAPKCENGAFRLRSRKLPRILEGAIELHSPLAKVSRPYWNAFFRNEVTNWPTHVENSWHDYSIFPFMRHCFLSSRHHSARSLLAFIAVSNLGFFYLIAVVAISLPFFIHPAALLYSPMGYQPAWFDPSFQD